MTVFAKSILVFGTVLSERSPYPKAKNFDEPERLRIWTNKIEGTLDTIAKLYEDLFQLGGKA